MNILNVEGKNKFKCKGKNICDEKLYSIVDHFHEKLFKKTIYYHYISNLKHFLYKNNIMHFYQE